MQPSSVGPSACALAPARRAPARVQRTAGEATTARRHAPRPQGRPDAAGHGRHDRADTPHAPAAHGGGRRHRGPRGRSDERRVGGAGTPGRARRPTPVARRVRADYQRMVDFGPRLPGYAEHDHFCDWLEEQFVGAGLDLIPCDEYEYDRWRPRRFGLDVLGGPRPERIRVATSFVRAKATPDEGVVGPLVLDDGGPAPGSVLLVDLTATTPTPGYKRLWRGPWPDLQPYADRGAAAVVFVVNTSFEELAGNWSPHTGPFQPIPALVVDRDTGRTLRERAAGRPPVRLTLRAPVRKTRVRSITAVLPGPERRGPGRRHAHRRAELRRGERRRRARASGASLRVPAPQAEAEAHAGLRGVAGAHVRHPARGARMGRGAPGPRRPRGGGRHHRAPGLPPSGRTRPSRATTPPAATSSTSSRRRLGRVPVRHGGDRHVRPRQPRAGARSRHHRRLGVPQGRRAARRRHRRPDLPPRRLRQRRDGQARREASRPGRRPSTPTSSGASTASTAPRCGRPTRRSARPVPTEDPSRPVRCGPEERFVVHAGKGRRLCVRIHGLREGDRSALVTLTALGGATVSGVSVELRRGDKVYARSATPKVGSDRKKVVLRRGANKRFPPRTPTPSSSAATGSCSRHRAPLNGDAARSWRAAPKRPRRGGSRTGSGRGRRRAGRAGRGCLRARCA